MKYSVSLTCLLLFSVNASVVTADDSRCDCNKKIAACQARVSIEADTITVDSSRPECSQVHWLANGNPQTTVVLDGREHFKWLGSSKLNIDVQSCEVCADSNFRNSDARAPEPAVHDKAQPAAFARFQGICAQTGEALNVESAFNWCWDGAGGLLYQCKSDGQIYVEMDSGKPREVLQRLKAGTGRCSN
jgi:hypothetical protein